MSRFSLLACLRASGLVALALLAGAPPAGAVALPAWLTPIGIALNVREWFEDSLPEEVPERRFLTEGRVALDAGDVAAAARAYEAALAANPDSIEGLTLLGLIREQQGRTSHAAALYNRVLEIAALRATAEIIQPPPPPPPPSEDADDEDGDDSAEALPPPPGPTWRDFADVAAERLAAMAPAQAPAVDPRQSLIDRLAVLDALLAEGFIDVEDHRARRAANVGVLLVRTATPPSIVLANAAPRVADVLARFAEVDAQRKRGVIDERRWSQERADMLDALLPLTGERFNNLAPLDGDALAELSRRGVLTNDEARRERSAGAPATTTSAMASTAPALPPLPAEKPAVTRTAATEQPASEPEAPAETAEAQAAAEEPEEPEATADAGAETTGEGAMAAAAASAESPAVAPEGDVPAAIGIHLASYRTPEQARQGWTELQAANADLLGALKANIEAVDRGDRGVYFEVTAGPLDSNASALKTCAALVARGLFCATTLY